MHGPDVIYCQTRLRAHGLDISAYTGVYDEESVLMVMALQTAYNLAPTGEVDEATWAVMAGPSSLPKEVYAGRRYVINESLSLIGVPYLHASNNPKLGLDPLGFLMYVLLQANLLTKEISNKEVSLTEFSWAFPRIDESNLTPGDLVFYPNPAGKLTHVLFVLNASFGVGVIGGNASTNTKRLALQRDAFVKIKNFRYRTPRICAKLASFTDIPVDHG